MPAAYRKTANSMDITRLVDDISRHGTAAPIILAAGAGAVPALAGYLDGPPRSVPHARLFAVSMLAAIAGTESTVALRRALHRHALDAFPPAVAEAEWLVKNAAFEALTKRLGPAIADEIDYGLHTARLPAAVAAVGQFGLSEHIPTLVAALADDILGEPARRALACCGSAAAAPLREVLADCGADVGAFKRAIAATDLLAHLPPGASTDALEQLLADNTHPALGAAAALALLDLRANTATARLATALTRGALLSEPALAERCLERLDVLPPRDLAAAANDALSLEYLPDLYGNPQTVSTRARASLLACLLQHAGVDTPDVAKRAPERVLLGALRQLGTLPDASISRMLERHANPRIREAVRHFAACPSRRDQ